MSKKLKNSPISVGAQNSHELDTYGAYTGSINSIMLKNVGAKYVIIGHSENRLTGETNKLINRKIKSALKCKLKVIFCIGESFQEKRKKITNKVLSKQIKLGLDGIKIYNYHFDIMIYMMKIMKNIYRRIGLIYQ